MHECALFFFLCFVVFASVVQSLRHIGEIGIINFRGDGVVLDRLDCQNRSQ